MVFPVLLTRIQCLEKALYIPSGFYNHSNILIADSVVVFGDGVDSTILYANDTELSAFKLIGNNSAVYNLWLTGRPHLRESGEPTWNLLWAYYPRNITVQNIRVSPLPGVGEAAITGDHLGVWGVGGIFLYGVKGGKVLNNVVEYPGVILNLQFSCDSDGLFFFNSVHFRS